MSWGWCDHEKMKRHKWQPTEERWEDQISHQPPGISARKNVYSSAARLSWTQEHSTLTQFITPAMLFAPLYWCWMFLWCCRFTAPCYRLDISKHSLLTGWAQMSKIGEFRHITWLCLFTLKPWAQGSSSVYIKAIQIQFTSACFDSEKQNLLKPLKVSDSSKDHLIYWTACEEVNILGFTSSGTSLSTFFSIFIKSIKFTSIGSFAGI